MNTLCRHALRFTATVLLATAAAVAPALQPSPRIIGGNDADNGEYPFMAGLLYSSISDNRSAFLCGGTVIAPRWILTAAHCVSDGATLELASALQVITGATALTGAARTDVAAIVRHPQFDDLWLTHDVALLYLAEPVTVDPAFAIDTGSVLTGLLPGDDLVATGWGLTAEDNPATPLVDESAQPDTLQEALLDYIPFTTCEADYYAGEITDDTFCAGFLSGAPRDTCYGDSGGPLLRPAGGGAWTQVGITSYAASDFCAVDGQPGIYADVGQHVAFIEGAMASPDLRVVLGTVTDSQSGLSVRMRARVSNQSPANTAHGTLVLTLPGGVSVTNGDDLPACSGSAPVTCTLPALAPGVSTTLEFALAFTSWGTFALVANVAADEGDYDATNDQASRHYTFVAPAAGDSGGGAFASLLWLALLAWRGGRTRTRPHAPHHPLRLR